jgi:NAD(P)-dependent dehydrogenase (short-subunit alcohol dehydrogenase family)
MPEPRFPSEGSNTNPVALVTGGSRGIGRAISIGLVGAGFDLVINYLSNEAAADEARKEAAAASAAESTQVEIFRADISAATGREELVDFTRSRFGRLDLLVNNAGVAPVIRNDLLDATEESFDRLIDVNLKGPYFLTQAVARWMIEQKAQPGTAAEPIIINITSISAYAASPDRGDYCVAKAGLAMATRLYAARLAAEGINVYEVRPGIIATDMTAGAKAKYDELIARGLTPIPRWGTPEDVARAVVAIARGELGFSTGEVINVDGGFHLRTL